MFTSILGTVVINPISAKDKLKRKKYMGVWRGESALMVRMISRFPSTVTKYMVRNSPKKIGCSSTSSERPSKKNSQIHVRFFGSM
jgi:hypothetical protein